MLSFKINPNPIIILFTNTNSEDKFILGFLLFCIIAATFTTVTSYKKKEKIKTKQVSDDIKKYFEDNYKNIFNFVLIVIPIVFIICFGIFSVRYDAKNQPVHSHHGLYSPLILFIKLNKLWFMTLLVI